MSSEQSGMGKSLYIHKMAEQLKSVTKAELNDCQVVIPIHGPVITPDVVLKFLKDHYRKNKCMIYHFDVAPSVRTVTRYHIAGNLCLENFCPLKPMTFFSTMRENLFH